MASCVTIVAAVHEAIQQSADVRGYFHWSLVDQFRVVGRMGAENSVCCPSDLATQKREFRPSADAYAAISAAQTALES